MLIILPDKAQYATRVCLLLLVFPSDRMLILTFYHIWEHLLLLDLSLWTFVVMKEKMCLHFFYRYRDYYPFRALLRKSRCIIQHVKYQCK